jgi:nitrite reductase (NADH) large subunit
VPASELTMRVRGTANGSEPYDLGEEPQREVEERRWVLVGKVWDFPRDGGATIKYGKTQIAVFNFASRDEWYATQNMCPHRREFVLSRGMIGDHGGKPKVACPVHKKTFSLETGKCLGTEDYEIEIFPVMVVADDVYLHLPPIDTLDALLATEKTCNGGNCHEAPPVSSGLKKSRAARKLRTVDDPVDGSLTELR